MDCAAAPGSPLPRCRCLPFLKWGTEGDFAVLVIHDSENISVAKSLALGEWLASGYPVPAALEKRENDHSPHSIFLCTNPNC